MYLDYLIRVHVYIIKMFALVMRYLVQKVVETFIETFNYGFTKIMSFSKKNHKDYENIL